jgi:hypothetical protein
LLWEREVAHDDGVAIADLTVTSAGLLVIVGGGPAGTDLGGGVIVPSGGASKGFIAGYALGR